MPDYKTPGVYIEEIPQFPSSVAAVETAVPAFIGYTEKADWKQPGDLLKKPFRIQSMPEYEQYFGNPAPELESLSVVFALNGSQETINGKVDETKRSKFLMHYGLQQFFANGGGPCWIVSAGDYISGGGIIAETALLEGLAAAGKETGITLLLFPDAVNMETAAGYYNVHMAAIDQSAALQDRFTLLDVYHVAAHGNDWQKDVALLRSSFNSNDTGLKYAAAYFPRIFTPTHFNYTVDGAANESLIKIEGGPGGATTLAALQQNNNTQYAAAKKAVSEIPMLLPVSPAIAGIYALVDNTRGVWKAPANVSLNNTIQPLYPISSNEQEGLNVDAVAGKSINAIRTFTGKGTLVWGARTLDGNSNDWRYISVRRYCIMAEQSIKLAARAFVFEPNEPKTWITIKAMIQNFLTQQWRSGALQGQTPRDAFFVHVGLGETMTAQDVLEGRLIVELGLAITRPAEFIVLRFMQKMQSES